MTSSPKYFFKTLFTLSFIAFSFALPARAADHAPDKYVYDPAHTQILFRVDHLGFSHPTGRFLKFSSGFTFAPVMAEQSHVDIDMKADSIDLGRGTWDDVMKGGNFLKTDKYPDITFASTKVVKTGPRTGTLTGNLTIVGVTKPVVLNVTYNRSGTHPYNKNYIAGFSATGKIKRSDFGINFGLPGIGDTVELNIEVEGIRQDFGKLNEK